MRRLLSANLSRLQRDKVFWISVLFMFGLGVFMACMRYTEAARYHATARLDDTLFIYGIFVGVCAAVFCSVFTGTEYSDGTIRNKLIVGHTRTTIYCAAWIASVLAAVCMIAAFLVAYVALGSLLLQAPQTSIKMILGYILISLFTTMAYVSLFHMLSMLIPKKSTAAVVCLLTFFGLFMLAVVIQARLDAPEFISAYSLTTNGVEQAIPEPNPKYLQPAARRVYQFFYDFLPSGQGMQSAAFQVLHPSRLMLYSAFLSAMTTIAGVCAFRKKNIV